MRTPTSPERLGDLQREVRKTLPRSQTAAHRDVQRAKAPAISTRRIAPSRLSAQTPPRRHGLRCWSSLAVLTSLSSRSGRLISVHFPLRSLSQRRLRWPGCPGSSSATLDPSPLARQQRAASAPYGRRGNSTYATMTARKTPFPDDGRTPRCGQVFSRTDAGSVCISLPVAIHTAPDDTPPYPCHHAFSRHIRRAHRFAPHHALVHRK